MTKYIYSTVNGSRLLLTSKNKSVVGTSKYIYYNLSKLLKFAHVTKHERTPVHFKHL